MRNIFILLIIILPFVAFAQQRVTYMQYNLLNYGNFTSYCTESNNNQDVKDEYIRTILDHVRPDILAVNEVGRSSSNATRLLEVLNDNSYGATFKRADITNYANSYLINVFFYNADKLEMESQNVAQTVLRDINHYRLYALDENLNRGDTSFLNCFVAHLKAGYDQDDEEQRGTMTQNLMNYIEWNELEEAVLFSGDMNFYGDHEEGVENLMEHPDPMIRFYDPVNRMGDWHNNSYYSSYHTQSTHSSSNGCASGGGMDDRFDFIFINKSIRDGLHGVAYVDYSYEAVGNDGEHFNKAILDYPSNTSVPSEVLSALYNNSDHLPVIMELEMDGNTGFTDMIPVYPQVSVLNPVEKIIDITCYCKKQELYTIKVIDLMGRVVSESNGILDPGSSTFKQMAPEDNGLYLINFMFGNGKVVTKKVVVR